MQGEAGELTAGLAIDDVYVLVARPVARDFESGHAIAEPFFEVIVGLKCQTADGRVQTVGADHHVELAVAAAA